MLPRLLHTNLHWDVTILQAEEALVFIQKLVYEVVLRNIHLLSNEVIHRILAKVGVSSLWMVQLQRQ